MMNLVNKLFIIIMFITLIPVVNGISIPEFSSAKFFYEFNETGATIIDSTGHKNGTLSDGTWNATSYEGGGYEFDGINDKISTGITPITTGNITFHAYIKIRTGNAFIISQNDGISGCPQLQISSDNRAQFCYNSATSSIIKSSTTLVPGVWYSITGRTAGTNMSIYVNGIVENSTTGTINYYNTNMYVGGRNAAGGYYNGSIDNVGVWNKALTDEQISSMSIPANTTHFLRIQAVNNLTAASINSFNISLYYSNGTLFGSNSTSTGSIYFYPLINDTLTAVFDASGFTSENDTIEFNSSKDNYLTISALPAPRLNITFYDEITNELITGKNISFSVINGNTGINYSTDNGTSGILIINSGLNEIIYNSELYYQRKYYVTVDLDEFANIRLYLLNKTAENVDEIIYTIVNENFVPLSNAYLKVRRRYVEDGVIVERLVEMSRSDLNGEGLLHLQKVTADYSFLIEYLGNTVLTTESNPIKDTTANFRAQVSEEVITSLVLVNNMSSEITYNASSNEFTLDYNDPNNVIQSVCMKITRLRGTGSYEVNNSCAYLSSGSIVLSHENVSGSFVAYAYVHTNTLYSEQPLAMKSITKSTPAFGQQGIFWAIILIGSLTLAGLWVSRGNPTITLTLFGIGVLISTAFIDLVLFTYSTIVGVLFGIGVLIYAVRRRGE